MRGLAVNTIGKTPAKEASWSFGKKAETQKKGCVYMEQFQVGINRSDRSGEDLFRVKVAGWWWVEVGGLGWMGRGYLSLHAPLRRVKAEREEIPTLPFLMHFGRR